jgi:hypothetical protein
MSYQFSNIIEKSVGTDTIDTSNIHIHDCSISWLGPDNQYKYINHKLTNTDYKRFYNSNLLLSVCFSISIRSKSIS